jgi:hypothetical protein
MHDYWFIIVIFVAAAVIQILKPAIKGRLGEKAVAQSLKRLPVDEYVVINDIILPTKTGGTTQIDHVVVSP